MGRIASVIKIISIPHGDAPEDVRQGWVGCVLPCEPECGHIPEYVESVLPKPKRPAGMSVNAFRDWMEKGGSQKIAGFSVDTKVALDVLRKKSRPAAKWFYDHGYPKKGIAFRFKECEVQVIKTVPDGKGGKLKLYDDMETGKMRPKL